MRWLEAVLGLVVIISGLVRVPRVFASQELTYDGPVNDYADILSAEFETTLETELEQLAAQENGPEIAVVTLPSLDGETVENRAQQLFDTWSIGKDGLDNGVLLLIAVNDRQMRIQTGYGVEAALTDAQTGRIIRDQLTPAFRAANYDQGVKTAIDTIRQHLQDETFGNINPINQSPGLLAQFVSMIAITLLAVFGITVGSYFAAWFGRSKAWWPGGLVGAGLGGLIGGFMAAFFFGIIGLVLDYILSKNYHRWKLNQQPTDWKKTWGGFWPSTHHSSSSSRSSGGSSFSFGGGSSGGGGASGSW